MTSKTVYAVELTMGEWEDKYTWIHFVTEDRSQALKFVEKYNRILLKWRPYWEEVSKSHPDDATFESRLYEFSEFQLAQVTSLKMRIYEKI